MLNNEENNNPFPIQTKRSDEIPSFESQNIYSIEEKNRLTLFLHKSDSSNSAVNDNLYLNKYASNFNPSLHKESTTKKEENIQNCIEKKTKFVIHKKNEIIRFTSSRKRNRAKKEKNEEIRIKKKCDASRQDNDRTKFIRKTLNIYWYDQIGNAINQSNKEHIKKFAEPFICEISKIENKEYLDMTLKDFYMKKELYQLCQPKIIKTHFEYNIKIIEAFKDNPVINNLLSKTFKDIIEEYKNSDEYKKYIESLIGYKGKKFQYFVDHFIVNSKPKK